MCRWRRPPVQKVDFIGKRDWSAALCEKSEGCGTIVSGTGNRNQSTEGATGKIRNIDPKDSFIIIWHDPNNQIVWLRMSKKMQATVWDLKIWQWALSKAMTRGTWWEKQNALQRCTFSFEQFFRLSSIQGGGSPDASRLKLNMNCGKISGVPTAWVRLALALTLGLELEAVLGPVLKLRLIPYSYYTL